MTRLPKITIRLLLSATLLAAIGIASYQCLPRAYEIARIPRPNSGNFTTAAATRQLPASLRRCAGIDGQHDIVQNWGGDFTIRVHVFRDGRIRVTDQGRNVSIGIAALEHSVSHVLRWGNVANALMTADTDGWDTPEKKQVLKRLFHPAWQIHVVNAG